MNKEIQIEHYNTYLQKYMSENKAWNTDKIRSDLKIFSMKLKSAIKVALEDLKETYDEVKSEGILEKLKLKNILFQYYVREHYSADKDIEMFKRLNNNDETAIMEFSEWL